MKNSIYILSIFIFLVSACKDSYQEIDWELNDQPSRLIVVGEVTSEYKQHTIFLKQSTSYFSNQELPKVSGATVMVSDGANTYSFAEDAVSKGTYISEEEFAGEVGKTYSLDIELESAINGETSYSASSIMNEGIQIQNSVSYIYENPLEEVGEGDSTVLLTYVIGPESPEVGDYYAINLYKNSKLLNDTIDELEVLYDDESGINGENLITFFFFEVFQETDTVTIEIKSVDKGYYEFIDGVKEVAEGYDPFGFSGPPANPVGNIQGGGAFGYFLASYVSKHSSYPEYPEEDEE
jgi:hypothetical protein